MPDLFANFAFAKLTADCSGADTVLTVDDVSSFPTNDALAGADMYLSIESELTHPHTFEIVKLTGVDTAAKTLTVARGRDGTSAVAHTSGVYVKGALTAGMLSRLASSGTDTTATHYKGAYTNASAYAVGDIVTYNNKTYVCTTPVGLASAAYVGASTAHAAGTTGAGGVLPLPAGSQVGDTIILDITAGTGSALPAGWTALVDNATHYGSSVCLSVGYKALTSSDISSGSVTIPDQAGRWAATGQVFRNIQSVGVAATDLTSTAYTAPAQTVTGDSFIVYAWADLVRSQTPPTLTGVSGLTYATDNTMFYLFAASAYESLSSGTSPTRTITDDTLGNDRPSSMSVVLTKPGGSFPATSFQELGEQSSNNRSVASISTNTTATTAAGTDFVYFATGTITLTLPSAVGNVSQYTVKNTGSGTVTVATSSGQTIDGAASVTVAAGATTRLLSDGTNWHVV